METKYEKSGKKLIAKRDFNAPLAKVWKAWTDVTLLDRWWAPKPYHIETKSMDFAEGGRWLYAMVSPTGDRHLCKLEYQAIEPEKSITHINAFCDEDGNTVSTIPPHQWKTDFTATPTGTTVMVVLTFDSESDLDTLVSMGFKEGFAMALGNLDEVLA